MSFPRTPRTLPGLLAGGLPFLAALLSFALLILQAESRDQVSLIYEIVRRPWGFFFWISGACTLGLALALFFLAAGRRVPLILPVALALVPWLAAAGAGLHNAQRMLTGLGTVEPDRHLRYLLDVTGELMWTRMSGAWSSATLLLAYAGGLLIAQRGRLRGSGADSVPGRTDRRLQAAVLLVLGVVGVTCLSEARSLGELLYVVTYVDAVRDLSPSVARAHQGLRGLASLRPWALGGFVLSVGLLGAWRLTRRPRDTAGLATLGAMALLAGVTLWVDGQLLVWMEQRLNGFTRPAPGLSGLQLLPLGGRYWPVNSVDIIATDGGLTRPGGAQVAWSEGEEALAHFLRRAVDDAIKAYAQLPYEELRAQSEKRSLKLAVDARMTVPQLRSLLSASSAAELYALELLTQRDLSARKDISYHLRAVAVEHPFLSRLVASLDALPSSTRVFLPLAYQGRKRTRGNPTFAPWGGEVGAEREVRLSPLRYGHEPVVLALSEPEEATPPQVPNSPLLYLQVTEQAALLDVAHTLRRAQARGFTVVLTTAPPPAELPED